MQAKIESKIDLKFREIKILDEYRIRLISDVVTGKLDVRDCVSSLNEFIPFEDNVDKYQSKMDIEGEEELFVEVEI